jgi:ubiquinone/menaquinone biosynthesis C-methylase UbiE
MEAYSMKNGQKSPKGAGKSSFELIDLNILKDILPARPGSVVLDLACGKGAYSLLLSRMVGRDGLVYAVDLWKEGLEILADQIEAGNIKNILPLLEDATREIEIDEYSLDLCLMATVLHDFEEAEKAHIVLNQVKTLLKPAGRLAVIEFKKVEGPPGPPKSIRLSEDEVEQLVSGHGFKKIKTVDIGDYNYLTLFRSEG